MKMAEIQYKKIGDKIVIVGFKNVLNRGELVKHLGEDSYFRYIYSSPLFYQKQDSIIIKTLKDFTVEILHIRPGDILTSSEFVEIIKEMKKAGNRLAQLRKESEKINTIKI